MKFVNSFELPLSVGHAWAVLLDVPRIAPCMPGAELVEIDNDRSFKGKVSVNLGPVALTFNGKATIESIDNDAHKARIKAQGTDAKGRGTVSTIVDFAIEPSAAGSKILIMTDLTLSGAVAQYGRGAGIIREVAAQLTYEFAKNLQRELDTQREVSGLNASASDRAGPPKAKPISGITLFFRAVLASLRNALGLGVRS